MKPAPEKDEMGEADRDVDRLLGQMQAQIEAVKAQQERHEREFVSFRSWIEAKIDSTNSSLAGKIDAVTTQLTVLGTTIATNAAFRRAGGWITGLAVSSVPAWILAGKELLDAFYAHHH